MGQCAESGCTNQAMTGSMLCSLHQPQPDGYQWRSATKSADPDLETKEQDAEDE
jgi:hypothetical protein